MATDGARGSGSTFGHGESNPSLALAVKLWPTPLTSDAKRSRSRSGAKIENDRRDGRGLDLATEVAMRKQWPTPTAMDCRSSRRDGYMITGHPGTTLTDAADPGGAGKLNPRWVEWLMGFPLGWTDSDSAEEGSFPNNLPQRSSR
jgi:hypothetical protein